MGTGLMLMHPEMIEEIGETNSPDGSPMPPQSAPAGATR